MPGKYFDEWTVAESTMATPVANLGYDKLVIPKLVFIGDTLHATSEVPSCARASRAQTPGW